MSSIKFSSVPINELLDTSTIAVRLDDKTEASLEQVRFTRAWNGFFSDVFNFLNAMTQSGTTAQRPTSFLFAGRPYFDTTLNKPIWRNKTSTAWIDATGASV